MSRNQYRTPDEDVTAEFSRVCQLFQLALGKPSDRMLFDSLMSEASANGLNWIEGLEYVIQQRQPEGTRAQVASVPVKRAMPVRFEPNEVLCKAS